MISPQGYLEMHKNQTYPQLIEERNKLIAAIVQFEKHEIANDGENSSDVTPSPEVRYQCNLEYLSVLCSYMSEKYNTEYVWGRKSLADDGK